MPFLPPTNSVKALKANHTLAQYAVLEGIDLALTDLRVREITFTYPSVRPFVSSGCVGRTSASLGVLDMVDVPLIRRLLC